MLFPGLKERHPSAFSISESTSNLTKQLIGQKADFTHLKSSKKILPLDNTLQSVIEMPQEEHEALEEHSMSLIETSGNNSLQLISGEVFFL